MALELFKGEISNAKKEVLTHTSGETKIATTGVFTREVSGSGSVQTHHEHYNEFAINNTQFRCYGDYTFKDGDKVALGAYPTNQGFYEVGIAKNATRNFYFSNLRKPFAPFAFLRAFLSGFFGLGWLVIICSWILSKVIGFDDTILNILVSICMAVVFIFSFLYAKRCFVEAREEKMTTINFEKDIEAFESASR